MSRCNKNKVLNSPWFRGLAACITLAATCVFAAWLTASGYSFIINVSFWLPVLIYSVAGGVITFYISRILRASQENMHQLTTYIETVHETERLNISREIHEELGQQLVVLKMDLSRLIKKVPAGDAGVNADIAQLFNSINKMIETVRKIALELRPGMLDDIGLVATLEWYCADFSKYTEIMASFNSDIKNENFPAELRITVFRIFHESLHHVLHYPDTKKIDVTISRQDQQLLLLIRVDENRIDPAQDDQNMNLSIRALKEKVRKLNGSYDVTRAEGGGTLIGMRVPVVHSH